MEYLLVVRFYGIRLFHAEVNLTFLVSNYIQYKNVFLQSF